jgi:hypothetical protein
VVLEDPEIFYGECLISNFEVGSARLPEERIDTFPGECPPRGQTEIVGEYDVHYVTCSRKPSTTEIIDNCSSRKVVGKITGISIARNDSIDILGSGQIHIRI